MCAASIVCRSWSPVASSHCSGYHAAPSSSGGASLYCVACAPAIEDNSNAPHASPETKQRNFKEEGKAERVIGVVLSRAGHRRVTAYAYSISALHPDGNGTLPQLFLQERLLL